MPEATEAFSELKLEERVTDGLVQSSLQMTLETSTNPRDLEVPSTTSRRKPRKNDAKSENPVNPRIPSLQRQVGRSSDVEKSAAFEMNS